MKETPQSKLSAKLQEAVDQGNWRVIRQLISTGAPPDTPTEWGSTALMAAATLDHKDAPKHVMFLVEHGSKVDQ